MIAPYARAKASADAYAALLFARTMGDAAVIALRERQYRVALDAFWRVPVQGLPPA